MLGEEEFEKQVGAAGRGILDLKSARGDAGQLVELKRFIVGGRSRRIAKNQPERMPRESVVAEKAFEIRFLNADLVVDGNGAPG